ncbi:MAG: aryl-sulfate sulfotransferase [Gemmatimonadota bacterium]
MIADPFPPSLGAAVVTPNPHNSLSVSVEIEASFADSARLRLQTSGEPPDTTPWVALTAGKGTLLALGLLEERAYTTIVDLAGPEGRASATADTFTTGALPERLREVTIATTGTPTHPLTLVNGGNLGTPGLVYAFDRQGRIRWYRELHEYPVAPNPAKETKQQPNGHITVFVGETSGFEPLDGRYVELGLDGSIVREYEAAGGLYTDSHELLLDFEGGALERIHLLAYDHRTMDFRPWGGIDGALVAGHRLQRLTAAGAVEFEWNAWDHLDPADWIEPPESLRNQPVLDFEHPNSIDVDSDGNYVVSWRHLGEVTAIDGRSGDILWRLGGVHNEFAFVGDPLGFFSAQHMARTLPNGNLLLFDNGVRHDPPQSRAVEYALDLDARTATMVWEYRPDPPLFSMFVSGAERLTNGNTLVGFGVPAHIAEVTPAGSVVWSAEPRWRGQPAIFYRAHALPSLYGYQRP